MTHNGGKYQTQFWFLYQTGQYIFMNKVKLASFWDSAARASISKLSANGYPTDVSAGSVSITLDDEGSTFRSGQRIIKWTGNATFTVSGATVSSGSLSGTNGRAVMDLSNSTSPKSISIALTATDGTLDNLRWLHPEDEAFYDAFKAAYPNREPFGTKFIQIMQAANPGVLRSLDAQWANASNGVTWEHRTPVSHYSYQCSWYDQTLYAGSLQGTSPTFTLVKPGFSLVDGATVHFDILAGTGAVSGTPTLNIQGTGDIPVKMVGGGAFTNWARSAVGNLRRVTVSYSQILNCWLYLNTNEQDGGLLSGMPPEVFVDLCNTIGAHAHFVNLPLAADSPSNFMQSLATYCASNLSSGLQFRAEVCPNELWNIAFNQTILSTKYAAARSLANSDDWCGRVNSLVGTQVKTIFSGDRTRYAVMAGFNTAGAVPDNVAGTNTSRRLESTGHVAAGGVAAKNFVTHVLINNYWTTMQFFAGTVGTSAEQYLRMIAYIAKARDWVTADAAGKQALYNSMFDLASTETWMSSVLATRLATYKALADNYNVFGTSEKMKVTFYEGNPYPGDIGADPVHGFDNIILGTTTIIVVNKINGQQAHAFKAGMVARFRTTASGLGLASTTQLNGNSYTVLSVTDTNIELNVDSTSFTPFVAGDGNSGAFTVATGGGKGIVYDGYGNTGAQTLNAFQNAAMSSPYAYFGTQKAFRRAAAIGEYPSDYFMLGQNSQWTKRPTIYDAAFPTYDAMVDFNNGRRALLW